MSTVAVDTCPPCAQVQDSNEGPRKRRKRAPAAGAADDCFTCADRSIKCDRRRPYCSPCLESGQDCAGYKTQLTWGNGVASRGKLRGLSLPVAGTKKINDSGSATKQKRIPLPNIIQNRGTASKPSLPLSPESGTETHSVPRDIRPSTIRTGFPVTGLKGQPMQPMINTSTTNSVHTEPLPSPASSHLDTSSLNLDWSNPGMLTITNTYCPPSPLPRLYNPPRQHGQVFDHTFRLSSENHRGLGLCYNPNSTMEPLGAPRHKTAPYFNNAVNYGNSEEFGRSAEGSYGAAALTRMVSMPDDNVEDVICEDNTVSDALSISSTPLLFDMNISWSPFSATHSVGKTPRMQYLIQYYAEVISPVIVAFDNPSNPFRDQILHLAAKNEGLQHALSALAASNLRQRQESGTVSKGKTLPARRSSRAHRTLTTDTMYRLNTAVPSHEQKREEVLHKYHAVQHVNVSLANHQLRKDDSVLATLLILCLFHVCDSGIARFQTQFAGVKKLLMLRRSENGENESGAKWMTRLFTLFDAMAATVNDREGQFDNQSLELSAFSDEEWSFETLAGVDGRLFKIMSQLGRLNILSQGKTVDLYPMLVSRPLPYMDFLRITPQANTNTFDGNGWTRIVDDENFFMSKTSYDIQLRDTQLHHTYQTPVGFGRETEEQGPRSEQFWREWREARQQLQMWDPDTLLDNIQKHPHHSKLTDDQLMDVKNISNAFRYSALLYTERLGSSTLPSSHENIQFWVRQSLYYIKRVRSDVYLLWPLFITGSECVHDEERNIIRERCLDIQKDSGFVNNASCLALLEKVWQSVPATPSAGPNHDQKYFHCADNNKPANGFRFRDVMLAEGNEGEWIVV